MIDQDRVATMTKLAIMEKQSGSEMMKMISYRKIDYMFAEMFRGFVAGTICYLVGLILWFCYLWDSLNDFIVNLDVVGLLTDIGLRYAFFIVTYLVIVAIVAYRRHSKNMRRRYLYLSYLRSLRRSYNSERMARRTGKSGSQSGSGRRRGEV